jgi:hypothetical protein
MCERSVDVTIAFGNPPDNRERRTDPAAPG